MGRTVGALRHSPATQLASSPHTCRAESALESPGPMLTPLPTRGRSIGPCPGLEEGTATAKQAVQELPGTEALTVVFCGRSSQRSQVTENTSLSSRGFLPVTSLLPSRDQTPWLAQGYNCPSSPAGSAMDLVTLQCRVPSGSSAQRPSRFS